MIALEQRATLPLFFEIHRMNLFSARSLDVDVVLDLMIHDVDIVLFLAKAEPEEIRAAGISILSQKVDIANVRLQFPNGCVANLTASRISTERPQTSAFPAQSIPVWTTPARIWRYSSAREAADRLRTNCPWLRANLSKPVRCVPEFGENPEFAEIFRGYGASNFIGCSGDS